MKNATQVLPVVIGITLCTASAALFYQWYRTRKSKRDELDGLSGLPYKSNKKSNENVEINSIISDDNVTLIQGRAGATLKSIEERTNVQITFQPLKDTDNHQTCKINGEYDNVMKACNLIKDELARSNNVTEEILIASEAFKLICRQGRKILHDVCQKSLAKIRIESGACGKDSTRRLIITGSKFNVQKAKQMIEEKIREDNDEKKVETKREPRFSQKGSSTSTSNESLSRPSGNTNL